VQRSCFSGRQRSDYWEAKFGGFFLFAIIIVSIGSCKNFLIFRGKLRPTPPYFLHFQSFLFSPFQQNAELRERTRFESTGISNFVPSQLISAVVFGWLLTICVEVLQRLCCCFPHTSKLRRGLPADGSTSAIGLNRVLNI